MTDTAYRLFVKNAKNGEWLSVGPGLAWWGFFQFQSTALQAAQHYSSLGLDTKIEPVQVEYDDR